MKRLRLQARKLSLLALFALALQLGLSFGHVHAGAFAASGTQTVASAHNPGPGGPDHDANDVCAICATVAMAGSLVDATPPILPVPTTFRLAHHASLAQSDAPDSRRSVFQSRAPPIT